MFDAASKTAGGQTTTSGSLARISLRLQLESARNTLRARHGLAPTDETGNTPCRGGAMPRPPATPSQLPLRCKVTFAAGSGEEHKGGINPAPTDRIVLCLVGAAFMPPASHTAAIAASLQGHVCGWKRRGTQGRDKSRPYRSYCFAPCRGGIHAARQSHRCNCRFAAKLRLRLEAPRHTRAG